MCSGGWDLSNVPPLPEGLRWGTGGIKTLGLYLGRERFEKQNWEKVLEKVEARLSKWKWLLPQLSYRGRVLIANNLVASFLWHRLIVLVPPPGLLESVQKLLVKFFWSGHHWIRASALYLPVSEGGQGLIDVVSRTAAFRLQTAQKLFYGDGLCWLPLAHLLLQKVGGLGLNKHLFLLNRKVLDLTRTSPFYASVLDSFKLLTVSRTSDTGPGTWLLQEPLFDNDFFSQAGILSSSALKVKFTSAGIVKFGHLLKIPAGTLGERLDVRSTRVMERVVEEVRRSLSVSQRAFIETCTLSDQWDDDSEYVFPSLEVKAAGEGWQEESGLLLNPNTPVLGSFQSCGKKQLYQTCVKVINRRSLLGVKESRWTQVFAADNAPGGSWRSLYKSPVEKRMADLQWRIIHGALATNRHRARFDPSTGEGCPFCNQTETLEHLVVACSRLSGMFKVLERWVSALGETFTLHLFVFGPKYSVRKKRTILLINFLFACAKLAIWKTRKNQMLGQSWTDAEKSLKGLVEARLKIEHAFYELTGNLDWFRAVWGIGQVLCLLDGQGSLKINF
uniref:Reverse transcriptase zinc-binding domain-containing protein n=1 Tax=Nothobranchius furzeri TaxID=105023 RepID=A0A1A8AE93_NOTFU